MRLENMRAGSRGLLLRFLFPQDPELLLEMEGQFLHPLVVAEGDLWHSATLDPIVVDLPLDLMRQGDENAYIKVSEDYGLGQMGSWGSLGGCWFVIGRKWCRGSWKRG